MKIIFVLIYVLVVVVTLSLCKAAKRADEYIEKHLKDIEDKNA
ncbi:MAG: hypothetical protein ACRDCB_07880 [Clostridium sp.]|nr:hypothetical protein [Clostridium sp. LY3-2]